MYRRGLVPTVCTWRVEVVGKRNGFASARLSCFTAQLYSPDLHAGRAHCQSDGVLSAREVWHTASQTVKYTGTALEDRDLRLSDVIQDAFTQI
jgi:hypothetical protein